MLIDLRKYVKLIIILLLVLSFLLTGFFAFRFLFPVRHLSIVRELAAEHSLDPALVMAVINAESRFRPNAQSHAGAKGLMQIMDSTAIWIAERANLPGYNARVFEPYANIAMGTWYLAHLINMFGNEETALAAYNAGQGRVREWLRNPEFSSDGITLDYIPFPETRNYVRRITRERRVYEFLLRWF